MSENAGAFPVDDGQEEWFDEFNPTAQAMEVFEEEAGSILAYAQANAPWADRTGDARAGLDYEVYEIDGDVCLDLFHTVDYGQWLETIQNGEFAIIMPTLELFAPTVFARVNGQVTDSAEGEEYDL